VSQGLASALALLVGRGATADELSDKLLSEGDTSALPRLYQILRQLDSAGLLRRQLRLGDLPFATLTPLAPSSCLSDNQPLTSARVKLSRFAYTRVGSDELQVESPLGRARVSLHHGSAAAIVSALAQPRSIDDLLELFPNVPDDLIRHLILFLEHAGSAVKNKMRRFDLKKE